MNRLLLLLSVVAIAAAGNYKGLEVVKVGKRNYKCNVNIIYDVSPPKCGKATAKCKPSPKKPIKVTIDTDDAKLTFAVQKNKVKGCKVEFLYPSTLSPTDSTTAGGGGGNSPSPGGSGGSSPFPPIISPGPGNSDHMSCNCRVPLMEQPAVALRNLDLGHSIARMVANKEGENGARPEDRMAAENEGEDRVMPEKAGAVERTFTLPGLPTIPADLSSLVPALLLAFVSAIVGILKGMLLSSVAAGRSLVEEMGAEQAKIMEKLKDRQGIEGILGSILGGNGQGGDNGGIQGLLGGILSGNGGGGDNGGIEGLLTNILSENGGGTGGVEEALVSAMLQNIITQIISNPESLQEMITLAVNSGLAEQVVTNLVQTGEINTLIQSLVDSGAAPGIIANFGNGLVQDLLNNNPLENINVGEVTQMLEESLSSMGDGVGSMLAGVDVQNMEVKMQCECVKEDPVTFFPIPGK